MSLSRVIVLSVGSNAPGTWGTPVETIDAGLTALETAGCTLLARSPLVRSRAIGVGRQPNYHNGVIAIKATMGPVRLLLSLKAIEKMAGRRTKLGWHARPLDLDIVDFRGLRIGHFGRKGQRPRLVLPHPEIECRAFVLQPLAVLAPEWRHPLTGLSARRMMKRRPRILRQLVPPGSLGGCPTWPPRVA